MSNPTSNFGWQMPEPTDLVTDLPADFEVFGQAVDTDFVDLLGGTTGQILSKTSATDLDFTWISAAPGDITGVTAGTGISGGGTSGDVTVTNSMATAIDAKGDLIVGTGADAFSRLAVGTNGQVLTADSSEATGLKFAAVASGGMTLLQTLTLSGSSTTSSSFSSSYKQILVFLQEVSASGSPGMRLKPNSIATGDYNLQTIAMQDATNVSGSSLNYQYGQIIGGAFSSSDVNKKLNAIITIMDPASTSSVFISAQSLCYEGTGTKMFGMTSLGNIKTGAAITTLQFVLDSGTYSTGTAYIYGVN